jgi:hypothetical protein
MEKILEVLTDCLARSLAVTITPDWHPSNPKRETVEISIFDVDGEQINSFHIPL